jgi:hypothetical protein
MTKIVIFAIFRCHYPNKILLPWANKIFISLFCTKTKVETRVTIRTLYVEKGVLVYLYLNYLLLSLFPYLFYRVMSKITITKCVNVETKICKH